MTHISVTAMFMAIGAESVFHNADADYGDEVGGQIGFMRDLVGFAEEAHRIAEALSLEDVGVFDYEVSEPFGAWYANQTIKSRNTAVDGPPTYSDARAKLTQLICRFYGKVKK